MSVNVEESTRLDIENAVPNLERELAIASEMRVLMTRMLEVRSSSDAHRPPRSFEDAATTNRGVVDVAEQDERIPLAGWSQIGRGAADPPRPEQRSR